MKKQFLVIGLLLSSVQVSKPIKIDPAGLALVAAAAITSCAAEHYYIMLISREPKRIFAVDLNRRSLPTRFGELIGMEGKNVANLLAASLFVAGSARLFPDTLSLPSKTAAGLGATALTLQAAFGGYNQTKNPLRLKTVLNWAIVGGVAGCCYNNVPFVHDIANGALEIIATNGFYQL
ncbi:MAG: hypothetical protein EBU90_25830, partial [Proteobacteria bacterium]|nr:hypothetical protein [Pseudomonadota bacterium]NBP16442.1 hypothetical protein [bacterium]